MIESNVLPKTKSKTKSNGLPKTKSKTKSNVLPKTKSKTKSNITPKSKSKSKSNIKFSVSSEKNPILMKLINNPINTSIIASLGGLSTAAAKHIYNNYGHYAIKGYSAELKRFNNHDYDQLKSLFDKNLTFKFYMDSGLQFSRNNFRDDKEKIKDYNAQFPNDQIKSYQDYVKKNNKEYALKDHQTYIFNATRSPPEDITASLDDLSKL